MIYVDQRKGSAELEPSIRRLSVLTEITHLEFGDFAFEGKGPSGGLAVGVERKSLHDMLSCIEDSRYAGHQAPGMRRLYDLSVLVVEGIWRPHEPDGFLMEGFHGGATWNFCKHRSQRTMYAKLFRYLLSVQLAGVLVTYSRDVFGTAYNVVELFHYFQKPWDQHTSMREPQRVTMPSLLQKPTLTRRWAKELEGIGTKLSEDAAKVFKSPFALANSDESEWLRVPGVGVKTAQDIYREIHGLKK